MNDVISWYCSSSEFSIVYFVFSIMYLFLFVLKYLTFCLFTQNYIEAVSA